MPKRIQRKRTDGWRMPPNAIYVGRYSPYGNPFINKTIPQMAVQAFKLWLEHDDKLNYREVAISIARGTACSVNERQLDISHNYFTELISLTGKTGSRLKKGKDLACWCALDAPCHADVLLAMANGNEGK